MRNKSIILLLVLAVVCAMASVNMPLPKGKKPKRGQADAVVVDTLLRGHSAGTDKGVDRNDSNTQDTAKMDSLQLAIYHHNRAIDDSIHADSVMRARSNGIDAPVNYSADDSLVYDAETGTAFLYGNSKVDYQNMKLKSDKVFMNLDSSTVRATGTADTTEETGLKGKPLFTMGKDEYESDTMAFNFKSKKGLIKGVYTEQQDGFLSGEVGKRDSSGVIYLQHGRYTTCDDPHPDFYIALSRAKVRPGKDVVFGPAYLVVADVPLPLAIPYGFFPFSKKYSSGFIMPSYGDEQDRGFYLRDGGYYFAISDKWDLKLLGEIYTKGSWGISAASNYRKRYKYSGSFLFSYQDSKTGDKGLPDFAEQESFKIQWSHRQDPKANPFSSLAASVNFATSSYERNNLNSMYNPQTLTQSTRTSSVSWSTTFSSIGLSLSATTNLAQNMRDSTIQMTLPDLNISLSRFYPFKRRHAAGKERWYEKISMSYTGQLSNSISTKEDKLLHTNLFKGWRNGFQHNIPVQANFTLFNYINLTPSFTFTDRMYSKKVSRAWDYAAQREVRADTTYGFHNVYNWSLSMSASTKLYGFWTPNRKLFGDRIQAIRHVITPQVSVSYSPDFSARRYGYYDSYQYTDADGNVRLVEYSPYQDELYGVPGRSRSEMITWDVSNNIEMKVRSDKDSTGFRKISLIDELGASMSYNAAADYHRWSDLSVRLRLKWWKNYTFSMNAQFATYAYEIGADGKPYVGNHTEWGYGRLPRFQGMSQNFSFTLNPEKLRKWFGGREDDDERASDDDEGPDTDIESNMDDDLERGKHAARKKRGNIAETDENGYMRFNMPWSLTIGYGITMRENTAGRFDTRTMRYPYKFTQTLNVSGNIRISDGWNINFSTGYDFENHDMSMTTASLSRDLHCFNMSASVVLAPYTSYNFTFRCNASTLTDALKYDKRSGISNAVQWY
ncbi:MAG: LPS-assembly protein LptD [Prevotella sp.]|nr:LPS-assembly protein LptD [Prevotella sp.]